MAYIENQAEIEEGWDSTFGDRKNEIVIIGQHMDETKIREDLDTCLATDDEIKSNHWKDGFEDSWPVPRANALM